jgi:hypothetical protein
MFGRLLFGQTSKPPPPEPSNTPTKTEDEIKVDAQQAQNKAEEERLKDETAKSKIEEAKTKKQAAVSLAEFNNRALTDLFNETKFTPLIQRLDVVYKEYIAAEIIPTLSKIVETNSNELKNIYPNADVDFLNTTKYRPVFSEVYDTMDRIFHHKIKATVNGQLPAYIQQLKEPLYQKIMDLASTSYSSETAQYTPHRVTNDRSKYDNNVDAFVKHYGDTFPAGGLSKRRKPRKKRRVTKKSKKKLN